jgi:hypothetical protein
LPVRRQSLPRPRWQWAERASHHRIGGNLKQASVLVNGDVFYRLRWPRPRDTCRALRVTEVT